MTKTPRGFFKPLAIGAPQPYRDLPSRVERMLHFVPPHLDKVRAKIGETLKEVDVIVGNLEDAIPAESKTAARAGFIEMAKAHDFAAAGVGLAVAASATTCERPSRLRATTACCSWGPPRSSPGSKAGAGTR